jgi:hypothetical protein
MPIPLKDIFKDMKKFQNPGDKAKRNPKDYPNVKIKNIKVNAHFGIKSVTYRALAEGSKGDYAVAIQFFFKPDLLSRVPIEGYVKAVDEKQGEFYHPQVDFNNTPVMLRGMCSDIRFRFSWWLKQNKAWIAGVKKYKKVPGSTRPPVNPKKVMGACKHVTRFIEVLQQNGVIGTIPGFVKS